MSVHIDAKEGEIAPSVLLPGDPLRAKFIAENYLENAHCYNQVRGMFGYTGTYKGKPVSVQGTGMGQPSISIYANELFQFYGVQNAIRIGTIGAVKESAKVGDIILAQGACSDSSLLNQRFGFLHFAPLSDFQLLYKAYNISQKMNLNVEVGNVVSSDFFYDEAESWKLWRDYGIKGIEMESAELFTLAAKFKRKALSIFTVSDNLVTHAAATSQERQTSFTNMMELALETILEL